MAAILAFFASGWGKVIEYGAAVMAVLGAVFTVYQSIKNTGKQEQIVADQTKELEDVKKTVAISNDVAAMSDADVHKRLYSEFSR